MRIMAFGAHPDDIEMLCAGTLAKYAANGHEVAVVIMTNGEVGSPALGRQETAAMRRGEAEKSAAHIQAEFFWLNYPDEFLFNTPEVRRHVIHTIRKFQPDMIITHDKDADYHPDHTNTGQLIWDTHVMVSVPNIKTETAPCKKIPTIYFMDTVAGVNFQPEHYVDITAHWETKASMLRCHKSQDEWLNSQYGVLLVEFSQTQSRFRGFQAGTQYAECFRAPKFFPGSVQSGALLPT